MQTYMACYLVHLPQPWVRVFLDDSAPNLSQPSPASHVCPAETTTAVSPNIKQQ